MKKSNFDLKGFRENELHMTQREFAVLLGLRQDTVSRMEKNSSQISLELLVKIAEKTGQTVDELIKYKKPELKYLEPDPKYEDVKFTKEYLLNEISKDCAQFETGEYGGEISSVRRFIKTGMRKPVIGILGRSDSGKSTLINKLIGGNRLPTGWTPKTSINVFIKHIDDRPKYMKDEVWAFGREKEWDHTRLDDEKYCEECRIASGTIDMLASFGTHDGSGYRKHDIGSAVVFLDAPILKNVDLLDIPGFTGAMERDTMLGKTARGYIDALVYLSQSNSFLIAEDMEFLKFTFPRLGCVEGLDERLTPFANIYVLASQAHIIQKGNKTELNNILKKGCSRFCKTLTKTFWDDRSKAYAETSGKKHSYKEEDLRKRFFPYSIDIPELCQDFEDDLKRLTEILPSVVKNMVLKEVKNQCAGIKGKIDSGIKADEFIIEKHEKLKKELSKEQANQYRRQADIRQKKNDVLVAIERASRESKENFEKAYNSLIDAKKIETIIEQQGLDKPKGRGKEEYSEDERKNLVLSYINSRLQDEYSDAINNAARPVGEKIKLFLTGFKSKNITAKGEFGVELSFDADAAFAAGLAGAGTAGGLMLASSMAGNLGGYILVAKAVGVLSTLGISVGGGAAATSAVAAIGGPVTLGLALTVLAAASAWSFFSSSWAKRIAKQICEQLRKQDALGQYKSEADNWWNDYKRAFNMAAKNTEEADKKHTDELANTINNFDQEKVQKRIDESEKAKEFFGKLEQLAENI